MFTWCRRAAKVNFDYWAGRICSASLKPAFMSVEVAVAIILSGTTKEAS